MRFLEALNRILVGMLLSLVLLQAGLLFFMKNMEDQAQFRLVQNSSKVEAQCSSENFSSDLLWDLFSPRPLTYSTCENSDCSYSHIHWSRDTQEKELHVVAVDSAPPFRWGESNQGGVIRLRVKASAKPQILTLLSRQRLEWDIKVDKKARIEKVIVASPVTVWLQGLPKDTPIEYLPQEKMCSYPYTWEEAFNSENEFRVLSSVLKKITNLEVNTFQGAKIGKEFRVPLFDQERKLASIAPVVPSTLVHLQNGIQWSLTEGKIGPSRFDWGDLQTEVSLPEKTQHVLKAGKDLFILRKFQLWRWNAEKSDFAAIPIPLHLSLAPELTAFTWSEQQQVLYVYNNARGGEIYEYNLKDEQWKSLAGHFNFHLQSLYFDDATEQLVALASRGSYLRQVYFLSTQGKLLAHKDLKTPIAFDRNKWNWQFYKSGEAFYISLHQPRKLQGEVLPMEF